jgi:quercetin dioxygenase-like cupin family protein
MKNVFEDMPYADDKMGFRKVVDEQHLLIMQIALRPGQKVPQHHANSNVHLLVIEGQVIVTLAGCDTELSEGSLLPVDYKTSMSIYNDSDANASFLVLKTPNPSEMGD